MMLEGIKWKWVFESRKAQTALAGLIILILTRLIGLEEEIASELAWGIIVIAGTLIGAIALEDAAAKRANGGKPLSKPGAPDEH